MSDKNFKKHFLSAMELRTICEVLREIYWHTQDPEIREKVVEAERMAKRMDAKLRKYKYGWDKDEWEKIDSKESLERAKKRFEQYEKEQK